MTSCRVINADISGGGRGINVTPLVEDRAQTLALQVGIGNVTFAQSMLIMVLNERFELLNIPWMPANRACKKDPHAWFCNDIPRVLIHRTTHRWALVVNI